MRCLCHHCQQKFLDWRAWSAKNLSKTYWQRSGKKWEYGIHVVRLTPGFHIEVPLTFIENFLDSVRICASPMNSDASLNFCTFSAFFCASLWIALYFLQTYSTNTKTGLEIALTTIYNRFFYFVSTRFHNHVFVLHSEHEFSITLNHSFFLGLLASHAGLGDEHTSDIAPHVMTNTVWLPIGSRPLTRYVGTLPLWFIAPFR